MKRLSEMLEPMPKICDEALLILDSYIKHSIDSRFDIEVDDMNDYYILRLYYSDGRREDFIITVRGSLCDPTLDSCILSELLELRKERSKSWGAYYNKARASETKML